MDLSTDAQLEQLFVNSKTQLYGKGDIIVFADRDPKGVMLIEDGVVEQYYLTSTGNKIVLDTFKLNDLFPMSWAINKMSNAYFYGAATSVSIRYISVDRVTDYIKHNPDVAYSLLGHVYKGADRILRKLVLSTSACASDRVVFVLLNEAYRFGRMLDDSSWRLINIKQQNVAELSGLARETVSRELNKLEKAGLIAHARQGLTVCMDRLEQRFEPGEAS